MKQLTLNLKWSVASKSGDVVAKCYTIEDAAAIVAMRGEGTKILFGRKVLWVEGAEEKVAGESYDFVADTCYNRLNDRHQEE